MHDRVDYGLDEDDPSDHLVDVDVVVQREDRGEAHIAEDGDGVAEDEYQYHDRVEEESAS